MSKHRLESFSDGMFAIVITLLILKVHLGRQWELTLKALGELTPYIVAFIAVATYGLNLMVVNALGTAMWLYAGTHIDGDWRLAGGGGLRRSGTCGADFGISGLCPARALVHTCEYPAVCGGADAFYTSQSLL
jgi:hypothetical protein